MPVSSRVPSVRISHANHGIRSLAHTFCYHQVGGIKIVFPLNLKELPRLFTKANHLHEIIDPLLTANQFPKGLSEEIFQ